MRQVALTPGQIVEAGTVLVGLDVSVEEAELQALEAQRDLAETQFARMQRMVERRAASEMELDTRARANATWRWRRSRARKRDHCRKTIRAPFRARIGISDVHPGQYLNEGTQLTTLQGVDDSAYVDFTVAQHVAATLRDRRQRRRLHATTRSRSRRRSSRSTRGSIRRRAMPSVRARVEDTAACADARRLGARPGPGRAPRAWRSSIPASALRKGPGGDHVFVLVADDDGKTRARVRQVRSTRWQAMKS